MTPTDPQTHHPEDVDVQVQPVPKTDLVHLNVGGLGGIILSRGQAKRLGRALYRFGHSGPPRGAGAASRGVPRSSGAW